MPIRYKILYSIQARENITEARWNRFVECVRADGRTIAAVFADFIDRYIVDHERRTATPAPDRHAPPPSSPGPADTRSSHDAEDPDTRGNLRPREHD